MAPSESFDPRTWRSDEPGQVKASPTVREPPRVQPMPPGQARRWLGFAVSAAILVGGAVAAYATRADVPANAAPPSAG
ncbi:MAG: hypothetical protein Q8R44_03125 [Novosphingobium sp.]|nr:hypothetical protein [Novosphingobium sp.]